MQRLAKLTKRHQEVLSFFNDAVSATGSPPSIREVMRHCGLKSPRGAEIQLKALAKSGHLLHKPGLKRAYRPLPGNGALGIPILGTAPAGYPTDQTEDFRGQMLLPWGVSDAAFAVTVSGDSMRDAHILHGDLVVVDPKQQPSNGAVVLATIDGGQTIKRLRRDGTKWTLEAANELYQTLSPRIEGDSVVGPVVALVRRMKG